MLADIQGARLGGVFDTDRDKAARVAAEYKTTVASDVSALLECCDAVTIATPTTTHADVARMAIEKGKHLFIEKPITRTIEEARDLCTRAAAKGVIVQVGHIERFNPAILALEKYEIHPMFVESHRLAQFNPRGTDVAVVLDLMIHDIDIILTLVKSPVISVSAVGVPVVSGQVDIANARLEFASGCVANITASRVSGERLRKIRVFQRDTYFVLDYANQELNLFRKTTGDGSSKTRLTRIEVPVDRVEPLRQELSDFLESVRLRRPPLVSGEAGREAVAVATQIIERL